MDFEGAKWFDPVPERIGQIDFRDVRYADPNAGAKFEEKAIKSGITSLRRVDSSGLYEQCRGIDFKALLPEAHQTPCEFAILEDIFEEREKKTFAHIQPRRRTAAR